MGEDIWSMVRNVMGNMYLSNVTGFDFRYMCGGFDGNVTFLTSTS